MFFSVLITMNKERAMLRLVIRFYKWAFSPPLSHIYRGARFLRLYFSCLLIFVNRCLIKDFEKRPSVTHLLDHPFIKGVHGKVLFLQKQLAKVLQDQKHLNPVVKTRYGPWRLPASSLWLFMKENGMSCVLICPALLLVITSLHF